MGNRRVIITIVKEGIKMYRTITYRAILVDAEINGKVYSCLHKILHNLDPADDVKSLENEIAATGNTSLYLGTSEWEEWY